MTAALWTKQRVATLTEMWAAGLWASHIAIALGGVTKNAVIGKAHRLGLPQRREARHSGPSAKAHAPTEPKVKRIPMTREQRAEAERARYRARKAMLTGIIEAVAPEPWDGPSISMLDDKLSHFMCREIVAGDGVDTMFCGAPTAAGSQFSYCPFHAAKNLRQVPQKARKPNFVPHRVAA